MFLSRILIPLSFDGYTLPYVGLTGEDFHTSARRSKEVASIKRPRIMPPSCTQIFSIYYCLLIF